MADTDATNAELVESELLEKQKPSLSLVSVLEAHYMHDKLRRAVMNAALHFQYHCISTVRFLGTRKRVNHHAVEASTVNTQQCVCARARLTGKRAD